MNGNLTALNVLLQERYLRPELLSRGKVKKKMNFTHRLTPAFLAAGMLVAPTAAQQTSAQANAGAEAREQPQGLQIAMNQISRVQQQIEEVMNFADSKRAEAENDIQNGAEVNHSVEVENGTKTISHEVRKDGETIVSFVKEIFVGEKENKTEQQRQNEQREEKNASSEARKEAGIQVMDGEKRSEARAEGKVEAGKETHANGNSAKAQVEAGARAEVK